MSKRKPPRKQKPQGEPVDTSALYRDREYRAEAAALKTVIWRLSGRMKTYLQATIDRYPRAVSPRQADQGDVVLPEPVVRHGRSTERGCDPSFGGLLCFHIGNAVLAYYYLVNTGERYAFDRRIDHLRSIANDPANYFPVGSDAKGYYLTHRSEIKQNDGEE